ncbi:MAG TPA: 3-oxoacyl-[acyl-carrier-protein] synthase III C-terminal domain-containing protein [Bacteroidales bacterium]|nr:3-oxoacyl-[acyl-carrier-protein] synthase III C-terminal domain-containing protein [Bacteroidales bacterium]
MNSSIYSVITGTGSYIPSKCIRNEDFLLNEFYDEDGKKLPKENLEIINKFYQITEIAERRHIADELLTSDMAASAAEEAISSAGIDKEELDYIIFAHNFGDIRKDNRHVDAVPALASRVKHKLSIKNPDTIAYDLLFGCPGWLQAAIQADYLIKSGDAGKVMVIGADALSRISDPHDRDSMLYADGAGAAIFEARTSESPVGILAHKTRSDTLSEISMLYMDKSYNTDIEHKDDIFLKMHGRKLYQYAIEKVPPTIKECLDKCNIRLSEIKKALIHQANGKMDAAILTRLFKLCNIAEVPHNIMPMTISWLGNTSVATIPTLLDLILKGRLNPHEIQEGDNLILASVGAGMNINVIIYKM